ncbi:MAG: tetratricopeptide repeat protein [Candidatus Neomarinimicrobiota bacterium]
MIVEKTWLSKIKTPVVVIISIMLFTTIYANDDDGIKYYKSQDFTRAREYYEQVLLDHPEERAASFGQGASIYQQGYYEEATHAFETALNTEDKNLKYKAYYNIGNALYQQQRIEESLAFYRKALEMEPSDLEAKFNYELLKYQMQSQEDQQKGDGGDQTDDQARSEQKPNPSQDKGEQSDQDQQTENNKEDQRDQDNPNDRQTDQPQDQQPQPKKSPEQLNAETILDALKNDEKIHQKLKIAQKKSRKLEKDW